LNNDNPEIRAAAISAIALRNQKIGMSNITVALEDNSAWVRNSAYLCLKSLTGKDFGNPNLVTDPEKNKNIEPLENIYQGKSLATNARIRSNIVINELNQESHRFFSKIEQY